MNALGTTLSPALQRLGDVSVRLSVELGRTDMALRDVLALGEGSVVSLDKLTDELLDITANGQVIAHGEVIAQDGRFALRIVSLAGGEEGSVAVPGPARAPAPSAVPKVDAPIPGDIPRPESNTAPNASEPAADAPGENAVSQDEPKTAPETRPEPSQNTAAPAAEEAAPAPAEEPAAEPEVDPLLDALDELTSGDDTPQADAEQAGDSE